MHVLTNRLSSCGGMAERNPKTPSRYEDGNDELEKGKELKLSLSPEPDDMDPEPGPGFGGCGCPPEVALAANGCGWWHSNVDSIKSTGLTISARILKQKQ
jgi:hypothetical protein